MGSHPAACLAASRAYKSECIPPSSNLITHLLGTRADRYCLTRVHERQRAIDKASPVGYIRDAKLRGRLFDSEDTSGLVSSVDTAFFVDHEGPLEALAWVRESMDWPLSELFDGHEFILILQARRRSRSRSAPGCYVLSPGSLGCKCHMSGGAMARSLTNEIEWR